jgi:hypothetical protein
MTGSWPHVLRRSTTLRHRRSSEWDDYVAVWPKDHRPAQPRTEIPPRTSSGRARLTRICTLWGVHENCIRAASIGSTEQRDSAWMEKQIWASSKEKLDS